MKKYFAKTFTLFAVIIAIGLSSALPANANPPGKAAEWAVSFQDDFNAGGLNRQKWATTYPFNRRTTSSNNEKQWYVDDAFETANGVLKIKAQQKESNGLPYTSGMIASYPSFNQQYGYYEMRARLPKGKGLWPAFWLLPIDNSWPPEIDMMENLGHETSTVYFNHHWGTAKKHFMEEGKYTNGDFSQGFHTFGLLWDSNLLAWYVDDKKIFETRRNIQKTPMYIIANLAVGGTWPGYPDAQTMFPAYYEVDYIRVWQKTKIKPRVINLKTKR